MVQHASSDANRSSHTATSKQNTPNIPTQTNGFPSVVEENEANSMSDIRRSYQEQGISGKKKTAEIITHSWKSGTIQQYACYLSKWSKFCNQRQINKYHPTLGQALDFLTFLHEQNLSYIIINTARSALSSS